jgi:hypothetical protein
MSAAALRVLPYDDVENRCELLPARLERMREAKHPSLQLLEAKSELEAKQEKAIPFGHTVAAEPVILNHVRGRVQETYPRWLIMVFAAGIIVSAIGLLLLAVVPFAKMPSLGIVSASCLVIGTTAVALSLLRGQDLEEFPS